MKKMSEQTLAFVLAVIIAVIVLLATYKVYAVEYKRAHTMMSIMCTNLDEKLDMVVDILGQSRRKLVGKTAGMDRPLEVWQSVNDKHAFVIVIEVSATEVNPAMACLAHGTAFPQVLSGVAL